MPVPAYTDLFNEAIDDLTATLHTISGLQVVNDPRNIVPPCILIDASRLITDPLFYGIDSGSSLLGSS